jgi:transposase
MKPKKNKVYLSNEQRQELLKTVKTGTHSAQKIRRAEILLELDENNPPVKTQQEIASKCQSNIFTVAGLASKFKELGLEAINRKQRKTPPITPIVTGEVEARIIAISCSEPPRGHNKWTLQMTADKLIELEIVPSISKDTVGRALKKRVEASQK